MTDPYKVLGVSPTASDDEIKQAYRELVRKYHPDKYANTDLAEMATEKMKEVNAAYEEIQRMRKSGQSGTSYGQNTGSGYYGQNTGSSTGIYAAIRQRVNSGDLNGAQSMLVSVPEAERNAEWNFLMGCVLLRRGSTLDAQQYLDLACAQNPYNSEYRTVRDRLRAQSNAYSGGYRTTSHNHCGCGDMDICSSLICADCCCECMGGDLISCC
ncbi:MAG: J domain-containing protein [Clostridia bacterium]|nr:J domain-containing protein [Clostridia bacterium]